MMLEAIKKVKANNQIMTLHCEDEKELGPIMGCMNEGPKSEFFNVVGINNKSEWGMIQRDVELLKQESCRYHVCHVSTKESVEIIKKAQEEGLDVTAEVSPHHLILSEEDITSLDTNYKMNPPLRSLEDQKALIDGFNNGVISCIATDHAPHSIKEKEDHFSTAPFGIIGLDMAFSTLYTNLITKRITTIEKVLYAMTEAPAQRFGIDHKLEVGYDANLTIIDINTFVKYTVDNIGSKSSNSPFMNKRLQGKICMTIK